MKKQSIKALINNEMNKHLIAGLVLLIFPNALFAQGQFDSVLSSIEKNNTTLVALRKNVEAEKVGHQTGNFLQNPEVEFNYLFGKPATIGNRSDFNISQSFDFPSAYTYRRQISNIKNERSDLNYRKQLKAILLEARLICIDLTYINAFKADLLEDQTHAQQIAKTYQSRFEAGDANILEFNKAQLNLSILQSKISKLDVDGNALRSELARLNNGKPIDYADYEFLPSELPSDFEKWYQQAAATNPLLNWLRQEMELNKKQVLLNKALSLPKIKTGYMSETVVGQQFQGITLGMTIPLWENKNTVKHAIANEAARMAEVDDREVQIYNQLKTLYHKALGLQSNVKDYRSNLKKFNNSDLLKKALDKGEISLLNYLLEITMYHDHLHQTLELERELFKTMAELNQYV